MIRLERVSKTFASPSGEVSALRDIDLDIPTGRIFGIIGRSGAGKSTLIRCVNLLERPTTGRVLLDGQDLTALGGAELREARRGIGMIFQHFNLLSSRTVYDNVALPLELAGADRAAVRAAVEPLLDLVGLADKRDAYPRQLSGGQKQRVGIARALANRPKVLLSDEATSALDPQTTKSILGLLEEINAKLGLTILLITHEMAVIRDVAHEVAVMDKGAIVERGPTAQVFMRPEQPITRDFVSGLFNRDLPDALQARLKPSAAAEDLALVRIHFHGPQAMRPVISDLVRRHDVDINLIHGQLDHIGTVAFGTLVVGLPGDPTAILADLAARGLDTELLGYVPSAA